MAKQVGINFVPTIYQTFAVVLRRKMGLKEDTGFCGLFLAPIFSS